jgi:pilus assembly protein Flp/PilA
MKFFIIKSTISNISYGNPTTAISMIHHFLTTLRDSKGATAIEYGLIAALIAVAAIGAMSSLGTKLGSTFNNVRSNLR